MPSKTYEVKLTAENSGLIRKLVESGDAVERAGSKMSSSASKHSGLIRDALGRVGTAAHDVASDVVSNLGLPVVGSLAAVGIASVSMADQLEGAQSRLQSAVKNAGGSWQQYSGQIDTVNSRLENLGFTNTDTESNLALLVNASHNVGQSLNLMGLSADIARGRNMSLSSATSILSKVVTGHVALLGRLGIQTKDATGKTISQQEALMLLAKTYGGDASRYTDTFAGKQQVLGAKMQDAGAKLGEWLIPKLQALAGFLVDDVIPAINKTVSWVQTNWPKLVTAITPTLDKIMGYVKGFVSTVQALWNRFGHTILQYVIGAWNNIKEIIKGAMDVIMGVVRLFKDLFTGNWSNLWNDVKEIVKGIWELIKGFIGSVINDIETILRLAWDAIKNAVHTGWSDTLSFFEGLPDKIFGFLKDLPSKMYNLGSDILHAIVNGIKDAGHLVMDAFKGILSPLHKIPGVGSALSAIGLARGGIVDFPTSGAMAILHGREAVLPLDDPARAMQILGSSGLGTVTPISAASAGGGAPTIIVNLNGMFLGANSQLVPQVAQAIENQLMRHGQNGGGARWLARLQNTGTGS